MKDIETTIKINKKLDKVIVTTHNFKRMAYGIENIMLIDYNKEMQDYRPQTHIYQTTFSVDIYQAEMKKLVYELLKNQGCILRIEDILIK